MKTKIREGSNLRKTSDDSIMMVHPKAVSQGTLRCRPSSIQNLIPGMGGNGSRNEPVTNTNENVPVGG